MENPWIWLIVGLALASMLYGVYGAQAGRILGRSPGGAYRMVDRRKEPSWFWLTVLAHIAGPPALGLLLYLQLSAS